MKSKVQQLENRRHKRLNRVFPIKFQFIDETGKPTGKIYDAYTRDVAKGGMAVEYIRPHAELFPDFIIDKTKLKLQISIPADSPPVDSVATVRWFKKIPEQSSDIYFLGLEYQQIGNLQQRMIEGHIKHLRNRPKFFLSFLFILTVLIIVSMYFALVAR